MARFIKYIFCIDVYHELSKCFSKLLQLEPCNNVFEVISDLMAHGMIFLITINFYNAKKMSNFAMMFTM